MIRFLATDSGRLIRVLFGEALLVFGFSLFNLGGSLLSLVGVELLAGGLFDFTLLGPLFGKPVSGAEIRRLLTHP